MNQQELKSLLNYDPITGEFTWHNGKRAGSVSKQIGYRRIGINNKHYYEHRLAWLYTYGYLPINHIDHINGIRDDNRIQNLREATYGENHQNRVKSKANSSGYMGVTSVRNKWQAQIRINKKYVYLGVFNTPEEASQAYLKAKQQYHTFNPTPRKI
jgi:hypothetical protein